MKHLKSTFAAGLWLCACAIAGAAMAQDARAQEAVRIGFVEGLSGPFANIGEIGLRHYQIAAEGVNARGGVLGGRKLEIVPFDTKTSPQEALLVLSKAIDQGIRYIAQGNGSSVALALSDAVAKHNARNPDRSVVFLNYAAVDPQLTNDKCNYWHFRFDADADMKMAALTDYMATQKSIRKVYLINQDYSFGQAVARSARAMLAAKRADVEIVGDDLHPLGKVKDFSPYVSKIKASGADSVITGNWGNDLALLVKAGKEAGLKVDYYTYYGGAGGVVTALGEAGVGHVKQVTTWHSNIGGKGAGEHTLAYRTRFPEVKDDLYYSSTRNSIETLVRAMEQAGSADPNKVVAAMETIKYEDDSGPIEVRADNHQVIQPLFISTLVKANGKDVKFDVEKTGFGFRTDARIEPRATVMPTTCRFEKP
ncbi:MAG TPA: branched-chain amino acid ABC transporter substrate-binding protein [Burkholderiales bacterium]|nr:branched-chain amino acid ABC transporter substrate-binding protein [Burkholderiales bacterium]